MPAEPFAEGEIVLLLDRAQNRRLVRLRAGAKAHGHRGYLEHDRIIGAPEGVVVRSSSGATYLVFRPRLADYLAMDDGDFFAALKQWSRDADPGLASLAGGLLHRRLLKCVEIPDALAFGKRYPAVREQARALARRRGFDADSDLVLDEAAEERYLPYTPGGARGEAILVHTRGRATPSPLEEVSDLVRRLADRRVYLVRWFCPEALRDPLRRLVARAAG